MGQKQQSGQTGCIQQNESQSIQMKTIRRIIPFILKDFIALKHLQNQQEK